MPPPETLVELVDRLLPTKYGTIAEAGRSSGVTYATWQNITLRGTVPTFPVLEKVASALDVPLAQVLTAARASAAARETAKSKDPQAKRRASRRRKPPDKRADT
jgi:hypothetical protein